jgi:hypothetical protein
MAWTWTYVDAAGAPIDDLPQAGPGFPTQADAESWIGEEWRALADAGVDAVYLTEDGAVVYGPMSLRPADG